MTRKIWAAILIVSVVAVAVTVVVIVRRDPPPVTAVPNVGSIRDLKPVTLPPTAPETQPPKAMPNSVDIRITPSLAPASRGEKYSRTMMA